MSEIVITDENDNNQETKIKKDNVINEVKDDKIGPWRAGWNISNCILVI